MSRDHELWDVTGCYGLYPVCMSFRTCAKRSSNHQWFRTYRVQQNPCENSLTFPFDGKLNLVFTMAQLVTRASITGDMEIPNCSPCLSQGFQKHDVHSIINNTYFWYTKNMSEPVILIGVTFHHQRRLNRRKRNERKEPGAKLDVKTENHKRIERIERSKHGL